MAHTDEGWGSPTRDRAAFLDHAIGREIVPSVALLVLVLIPPSSHDLILGGEGRSEIQRHCRLRPAKALPAKARQCSALERLSRSCHVRDEGALACMRGGCGL